MTFALRSAWPVLLMAPLLLLLAVAWSVARGAPAAARGERVGAPRRDPFRADRRIRTGGAEGSGLGLAIVQAIAQRYGATVALAHSRLGGLSVSVTWRASPRRGPDGGPRHIA